MEKALSTPCWQPTHKPGLAIGFAFGIVLFLFIEGIYWWYSTSRSPSEAASPPRPLAVAGATSPAVSPGNAGSTEPPSSPEIGGASPLATLAATGAVQETTAPAGSAKAPSPAASSKPTGSMTSGASPASSSTSIASASSSQSGNGVTSGPGLFGVTDPVCGPSGAAKESTPGKGPNGAQSWLNCGLSKDKPTSSWTPPTIKVAQLAFIDMEKAKTLDLFKACAPCPVLLDQSAPFRGSTAHHFVSKTDTSMFESAGASLGVSDSSKLAVRIRHNL